MPFCVLTTTVSGPKSGCSGGASAVRLCALTPRKTTSAVPIVARSPVTCGPDLEVAVRRSMTRRPRSCIALQVRAAREQHDVGAGSREPRADVAADRAGARR